MTNEEILSDFMQKHYTDERLAALLAHAEDGKLSYMSCCCLIGVATADHALQGRGDMNGVEDEFGLDHYDRAELLPNAIEAEDAYLNLAPDGTKVGKADQARRAKLIPLIRAEITRREAERNSELSEAELAHTV